MQEVQDANVLMAKVRRERRQHEDRVATTNLTTIATWHARSPVHYILHVLDLLSSCPVFKLVARTAMLVVTTLTPKKASY